MSEHYDFHYQPTGSGAISGQQVLQQTEDAINELGDYVNDNVGGAMDVAQQALETAQNAEQDAQTALDTANSFSSAIQSAQQDASTALSTAQTAQTTASNANNTAIQASQDASNAVTTANNASGQVSTLSGTVTALGQRVTTAEGNIGQNTSDITALTTRVGTAEGNITTLQNDVSIAQGNASSAMATAGTVKQQAYVFRYSSTVLVASSTNSNTLLDNTDNLKVGDKVIDSNGVLFSITAIDTANSTFTVGSALIDLALDANVVHTNEINSSGIGIIGAIKEVGGVDFNTLTTQGLYGANASGSTNNPESSPCVVQVIKRLNSVIQIANVSSSAYKSRYIRYCADITAQPPVWQSWIKFAIDNEVVHKSGDETISGSKTFSSSTLIYNSDNTANTPNLILQSSKIQLGDTTNWDTQSIVFNAGSSFVAKVDSLKDTSGTQNLQNTVRTRDTSNNVILAMYRLRLYNTGLAFLESNNDNTISLGRNNARWKDCQTYLINGLTPSSLGMPSDRSAIIDISSYITNLGNGDNNQYIVPANGYIWLHFTSINSALCYSQTSGGLTNYAQTFVRYQGDGQLYAFFPVRKDDYFIVQIYTSSTAVVQNAYFIPCQGNV